MSDNTIDYKKCSLCEICKNCNIEKSLYNNNLIKKLSLLTGWILFCTVS
jgi:hypothetical protein